jgi:hypothetical protein
MWLRVVQQPLSEQARSAFAWTASAFSLLLCAVKFREMWLFLNGKATWMIALL